MILTEGRAAEKTRRRRKRGHLANALGRACSSGLGLIGLGGVRRRHGGDHNGTLVYVALSDGELVSVSCDLRAMAATQAGLSPAALFGALRCAIGSSLPCRRYPELAEHLLGLRLQAEVVSSARAPFVLREPEAGAEHALSSCPSGALHALGAAEAVRVTLVAADDTPGH